MVRLAKGHSGFGIDLCCALVVGNHYLFAATPYRTAIGVVAGHNILNLHLISFKQQWLRKRLRRVCRSLQCLA